MRDIGHKPCALLLSNLLEFSIVPVTRVRRSTTDDETRLEDACLGAERGVIDEVRFRGDGIGKGLEVDRGRSHFLFRGLLYLTLTEFRMLKKVTKHT